MKEKKNIIQVIVFVVLVLAIILVLGRGDRQVGVESKDETATSTPKVTEVAPGIGISGDGDYTVEVEKIDLTQPSLDKVVLGESAKTYPQDVQNALLKSMREVVEVLKKDGSKIDYWLELANLRKQAGDFTGAIAIWEYLIKLSPTNYVYYSNIGNAYHYNLKNYPKAEEYLKRVVELNPKYVVGYRDLSDLYRLSYKKETMLAADTLKAGLVNNPNHIDLLAPLAAFYRDIGDKKTALAYYEQALSEATRLKNANLVQVLEKEIAQLK